MQKHEDDDYAVVELAVEAGRGVLVVVEEG